MPNMVPLRRQKRETRGELCRTLAPGDGLVLVHPDGRSVRLAAARDACRRALEIAAPRSVHAEFPPDRADRCILDFGDGRRAAVEVERRNNQLRVKVDAPHAIRFDLASAEEGEHDEDGGDDAGRLRLWVRREGPMGAARPKGVRR